ncbi:MAG TPA: hypothetical protein VNK49_08890 [Anaerolineales bacterium]|nr:hypothetical protein [Anaerolineales bacterium]
MPRQTRDEIEVLREKIREFIERNGYVPSVREAAEMFNCAPTTAWRIIRSLGWKARGHRWVKREAH